MYLEELNDLINEISLIESKEIIRRIALEIPEDKREKVICMIENMQGELAADEEFLEQSMESLKEDFEDIKEGDICFQCYSEESGEYGAFGDIYDYYYYSTKEMDGVLAVAYDFAKELIFYKEYGKAIQILDLILFTNYSCEERGNPEYQDTDEVFDTFEIDITEVENCIPFSIEELCRYGIYAVLKSTIPDPCSKIYQYLEFCTHTKIKDTLAMGIEPVNDIEDFYQKWQKYLEKKNTSNATEYLKELKNKNIERRL